MSFYQRYKQSSAEHQILDFAPDLAFDQSNQDGVILIDMDQAQPTVKGYQALNAASPYVSGALSETPTGSTLAYFTDNSTQFFAGGSRHLWRAFGNIWVQADLMGATPFGTTSRWRFTQFNDDVIAVNAGVVAPQVATGSFGIFSPLGGGPPANATCALAINGQVLMFADAHWYASALLTDNDWTPDIQTQAGSGPLTDYPGVIVACAPIYRNAIAFKTGAMWIGSYVGGQAVWSWQLISDITGTWCQESVVPLPDSVAFLGIDDFYLTYGYTPQRIPNHLKEWFFDVADQTQFTNMLSRYDANHAVVYWYFVSKTPPVAGVPDRYVAWNARTGRWAAGYLVTPSVPAPNVQSGLFSGFYFDQNNILQSWTGTPGSMMLATSYFGMTEAFTQCLRMRPIYYVAPQSTTIQPFYVKTLGNPDKAGPTPYLGSDGWFYFRQYSGWHRFQINTTGPGVQQPNVQTGAEISAIALDLRVGGLR